MDQGRALTRAMHIAFILTFSAMAVSCGVGLKTTEESILMQQKAEEGYCSSSVSVTTPLTITSTANYYYRATDTSMGLTGSPVLGKIPYAEVMVTDASGLTVACSNTGAAGEISVNIQNKPGTYNLRVNSRANNSKINLSVLKDINTNDYYSISQNFTVTGSDTGSKAISQLYAYARLGESSNMEGGAFHILNNIYRTNEYIRNKIGSPAWVASKVSVYWKAGFNPYSYINPAYANKPLSFYSTGNSQLFILGGVSGDVKTSDTDHWDDSLIIHEYGHFLEDVYAKQESPGGSHNGNFIIDPRLAWSEGWANFLQSAVLTNWDYTTNTYSVNASITRGKYYVDTVGFSSDTSETGESGYVYIIFNLTESGTLANSDRVTLNGEGTFRELSVARTLYKAVSDTNVTAYGADVPFAAVWNVFTSTSNGFRSNSVNFRNIGLFNSYLTTLITSSYNSSLTAWNTLMTNERQNTTTADYADPITWNASCPSYPRDLTPVADSLYDGQYRSNKLRSNDFYLYYYDGTGGTVDLDYSQQTVGKTIDLDLVIYRLSHSYYEQFAENAGSSPSSYGVAVRSARSNPGLEAGAESLSLSGLSAGYYLLNVRANTYGKTSSALAGTVGYSINLTKSGTTRYLCPQN